MQYLTYALCGVLVVQVGIFARAIRSVRRATEEYEAATVHAAEVVAAGCTNPHIRKGLTPIFDALVDETAATLALGVDDEWAAMNGES